MITLLSIIALGFFLGMRHATDPDHVIAVTTIVSRQRSIRHAALIGVLWGLGHTITILVVGSAIILFGLVIPPRLGLTMELSVGLMLILLGVLNLSGIMRWITENLTPLQAGQHSHPHGHGDYVHNHPHGHNPESHGHVENATPLGWMDRTFGKLGLYQVIRPLAVGIVHGSGRIGSRGIAGAHDDPCSFVGDLLPPCIRDRHRRRNDAHHRGNRSAVQIFLGPFRSRQSRHGIGLRTGQPRLRPFHRLPNGLRQSPVHPQSDLDAALDILPK